MADIQQGTLSTEGERLQITPKLELKQITAFFH
jgi:hypothetical protein